MPSDVQAAIAAVDEAAKKLPEIEVDLMATEGFGQAGAETEPPKLGSKVRMHRFLNSNMAANAPRSSACTEVARHMDQEQILASTLAL